MLNSSLQPAISNNIYLNINLKVTQVCLEKIYHGGDVVAILPTGYMESQSYFIFFLCCFSTKTIMDVKQHKLIL